MIKKCKNSFNGFKYIILDFKPKILEFISEKSRTRDELVNEFEIPRTSMYVILLHFGDWEGVVTGSSRKNKSKKPSINANYTIGKTMIGTGEITRIKKKRIDNDGNSLLGRPKTLFQITEKGKKYLEEIKNNES